MMILLSRAQDVTTTKTYSLQLTDGWHLHGEGPLLNHCLAYAFSRAGNQILLCLSSNPCQNVPHWNPIHSRDAKNTSPLEMTDAGKSLLVLLRSRRGIYIICESNIRIVFLTALRKCHMGNLIEGLWWVNVPRKSSCQSMLRKHLVRSFVSFDFGSSG
jgi:hypothetical protein